MRMWAGLAIAGGLWGQSAAPVGVLRATFLERDGTPRAGTLSVRTADNHVYCYRFDPRTYFERASRLVGVAQIAAGDRLEIVADKQPGVPEPYARIVRIVDSSSVLKFPNYRTRYRIVRDPTEEIVPRGTLTYAGLILRLGDDSVLIRARDGTETRILLRDDTRYNRDGLTVERAALSVNSRVFVRAGKNLEGDIEAYQVSWGCILKP